MGRHLGYRATRNPNGTWKAWAFDPAAKRYVRRSPFASESLAVAHAKLQHARFLTRQQTLKRTPTRAIADDYLAWLAETKGRNRSHVGNVRRALIGGEIGQEGKPKSIRLGLCSALPDPAHPRALRQCEEWVAGLPVGARTKVQYLIAAKSMFRWAVPRGYLTANPIELAETVEPDRPLREQYTLDELLRIVHAGHGERLYLRACLMIYAGVRFQEALFLRWEDIDWNARMIAIRLDTGAAVKRRKERLVPLMDELAAILTPYRKESGRICDGQSLTNARRGFYAFLRHVGVTKGKRNQHAFRHTYAGLMTATGVPSLLLRAYMGHSTEKTTAGYTDRAVWYKQQTEGWPLGQFRILEGAHTEWRCAWPRT